MDRVVLPAVSGWAVHVAADQELAPHEAADPVVRREQAPVPDPVARPAQVRVQGLALVVVLRHLPQHWECRTKSAREAKRT